MAQKRFWENEMTSFFGHVPRYPIEHYLSMPFISTLAFENERNRTERTAKKYCF